MDETFSQPGTAGQTARDRTEQAGIGRMVSVPGAAVPVAVSLWA
jgi:hypothetical protein